jgi:sec-independent protein translocase protein TatA
MAFDDPIVWILIVGAVVFLFGSSKIPSLAKALGQARREFNSAMKGEVGASSTTGQNSANSPLTSPPVPLINTPTDPLIEAAQKEGIDVTGKTKQQIASELSWKLNNH